MTPIQAPEQSLPTPMVFQCCGREVCDGTDCPNKGPWSQVPAWRMSGYYYSFDATGNAAIDRILSAVGCAGKAFHHTESWGDELAPNYYEHLRGNSPIEWIQNAAIDALAAIAAQEAEVGRLREAAEAVLSNQEHAFSGGMCSYQVGSPTWQIYEDLRAALTQGETK